VIGFAIGREVPLFISQMVKQPQNSSISPSCRKFTLLSRIHNHPADAISLFASCPSVERGHFGSGDLLGDALCSEKHGGLEVDQKIDRALSLFTKNLRMGMASSCGHSPIHSANIITGLIASYLIKIDASTTMDRETISCPLIAHFLARWIGEMDAPRFKSDESVESDTR
jgi:hypothetical protein